MTDLNEESLIEALAIIRSEPPLPKATKLIVTAEGVALFRHRYATEAKFRATVQEHARHDRRYRKLLENIGCLIRRPTIMRRSSHE